MSVRRFRIPKKHLRSRFRCLLACKRLLNTKNSQFPRKNAPNAHTIAFKTTLLTVLASVVTPTRKNFSLFTIILCFLGVKGGYWLLGLASLAWLASPSFGTAVNDCDGFSF